MADHLRAQQTLDQLVTGCAALDWADPRATAQRADHVLHEVSSRPHLLATLVAELAAAADTSGCESYPAMDKLLLWRSDDDTVRLRLHVFQPGYSDRPHNHRWDFAAHLVAGGYLHAIFGTDREVRREAEAGIEPRPRYLRHEPAGSSYFLEHTLVHALRADEVTVSLVLRGPAVTEQYFTVLPDDGATPVAGRIELGHGAAQESAAKRRAKQMDAARLHQVAGVLEAALRPTDRRPAMDQRHGGA